MQKARFSNYISGRTMVEGYQDSSELLEEAEEVRGTVKWFNSVK